MTLFPSWKNTDQIFLLERLELYISAGLPLDKVLQIVANGSIKKQQLCIERVHADVISGVLLSKSFVKHIKFSTTLAGLIEHGESSGELLRALATCRILLEKQVETLKKCTSALIYPSVIAVFASLLTIGLVRGVMPQIIPMLKSLNVALPLLTRVVIAISENMLSYGLYALGGLIVMSILLFALYTRVPTCRHFCHSVIIRIPVVGRVFSSYSLSLFLQSLGSLVDSGLPVAQSYGNTVATIPLLPLRSALSRKIIDIKKGVPCGTILSGLSKKISKHVPSFVAPLLLAGEASGTLGTSLIRAASIIDRDIDHSLKRLTALIEPLMMVGMGGTVGSIALSIMMPIYDISKVLQR